MQGKLDIKYQVKTQLLGPGNEHQQQLKLRNRVIIWHGHKGVTYEADPRHAELVIERLELKEAKVATTPGTREEGRTRDQHVELLSNRGVTRYRVVMATCSYLAPDRPDVAYAVEELARAMAKSTHGDAKVEKVRSIPKGQAPITATVRVAIQTRNVEDVQRCRSGRLQRNPKMHHSKVRFSLAAQYQIMEQDASPNSFVLRRVGVVRVCRRSRRNTMHHPHDQGFRMEFKGRGMGRCQCGAWHNQQERVGQDPPHTNKFLMDSTGCCRTTLDI